MAITMSIRIIEVFVQGREFLLTRKDTLMRLERIERAFIEHNKKICSIFDYFIRMEKAKEEEIQFNNENVLVLILMLESTRK